MALIKCKGCGQMISDRATKCPKCGCPTTKRSEPHIPQETPQVQPVYYEDDEGGSSRKWLYGIIAVLSVAIAVGGYYVYYYHNHSKVLEKQRLQYINDSIAKVKADSISQALQDSLEQVKQDSIARANIAESYKVIDISNEDYNNKRIAVVSNRTLTRTEIGEDMAYLKILDEHDYDGNGIKDCLIVSNLGGSGTPNVYEIVYYDENTYKFKSAEIEFDNDKWDYYEFKKNNISIMKDNGVWLISFKLGIEKRTFCFDGVKATIYKKEKKKVAHAKETFTHMNVFNNEETESEETRQVKYDIDGDGIYEIFKFYSNNSHVMDWGRWMSLEILWNNGRKATFGCCDKFEVLSNKTKGVHDILVNNSFLYKWDGNNYKAVR